MKLVHTLIIVFTVIGFPLVGQQSNELVGMPCFEIIGDDSGHERLPLKSIQYDVEISGVIANVKLHQKFVNSGNVTIEARYVFPGSLESAVHSLKMKIGDRTIVAEVEEREEAKLKYAKAKALGHRSSLLEQHRPNVFQMNVANIAPGDTIVCIVGYTEFLNPDDGKYTFSAPMVVGPRYKSDGVDESWVQNPYLDESMGPTYATDIKLSVSTGVPIQSLRSTTHNIDVAYKSASSCVVSLAEEQMGAGNRDFSIDYYLKGQTIEGGLLLYEGTDENFFSMVVQPPKKIETMHMPAREYVFVLDVSGSMSGFPLDIAKSLLLELLAGLQPYDKFNVTTFAGGSASMFKSSVSANPDNIKQAQKSIRKLRGGGGTELKSALEKVMKNEDFSDYSRSIVVITDGFISAEKPVFNLIRENLSKTNVFTFGIGSSVNEYLIKGLAKAGKGEPFIVNNNRKRTEEIKRFTKYISSQALTNISIDYGENDVYDIQPEAIPDLMADRPIVVFGKYKGKLSGEITVMGDYGEGKFTSKENADSVKSTNSEALKYLWARTKIADLDDYGSTNKETKKVVTELGLNYNLLTQYTSFIAVDSEYKVKNNGRISVTQPLPLPKGVSNSATAYRYSMNATGATLRAASASTIEMVVPENVNKLNFINRFMALRWMSQESGMHSVSISDIFNNNLFSSETAGTMIIIDFSDPALTNESNLYIVKVMSGDESSNEIALAKEESDLDQLVHPDKKMTPIYYIEMAKMYEENGYLMDAITSFLIGLHHYSESQNLQDAFAEFTTSNNIIMR